MDNDNLHEFCPRCEANLVLQKGYNNELPYWVCKGCGEMLINPAIESESDIAWICDGCEAMLNIQEGFTEDCGEWTCTECGFTNKIDQSEIYVSDDEYIAVSQSMFHGMSDEDMCSLMCYVELDNVKGREDIALVEGEEGRLYIRKYIKIFDESVYRYLQKQNINNMPRITEIFKSDTGLIIIEEYIKGQNLAEKLENGSLKVSEAVSIAKSVAETARRLHNLEKPVIHRDIKPSNVIIDENNKVFLIDINVAKWYDPNQTEDTKLLGTMYYAAPEQLGYGFSASSEKSDIYAIGILLNVMVTGRYPKEEKAIEPVWNVVSHCICLEPAQRYTDDELIAALDKILE